MRLNYSQSGDDELRKGMERTAKRLPGDLFQAMKETTSLVRTRATTHHLAGATLKPHTHSLQRSVKEKVKWLGPIIMGIVGIPAQSPADAYGAIHEFGGVIKAKPGKFLVFQIGGKWIRTKQVDMPKREWLLKSWQDVQSKVEIIFGRKIEISIG